MGLMLVASTVEQDTLVATALKKKEAGDLYTAAKVRRHLPLQGAWQ